MLSLRFCQTGSKKTLFSLPGGWFLWNLKDLTPLKLLLMSLRWAITECDPGDAARLDGNRGAVGTVAGWPVLPPLKPQ